MQVTRGDLSPDTVGHARRREIDEVRTTQETRRTGPAEPAQAPEEPYQPQARQQALLAQRHVARAQSVLAGLEGFREYLLLNGGAAGGPETAAALRRATYQGELVLEPYRDALVGIAARGDLPTLERLIANVRQTVASQAPGPVSGEPSSAALQRVLSGIRSRGEELANLDRSNVLKLLG